MDNTFEKGEELYNIGCFEKSFQIFKDIFENSKATSIEKSDVLNMIGVLLKSDPSLSIDNEFEESVACFKEAIQLNPKNLGALLSIIEDFGNSFDQHRDFELFNLAYDNLKKLINELSDSNIKMIEKKYSLFLSMRRNLT